VTSHGQSECVVVDTNVLAVAEGMHSGASDECRAACLRLANRLHNGLVVAVDSEASGEAVLREYLKTLKDQKTAGVGTKLAVHLWRRRRAASVCRAVDLTLTGDAGETFEEVPAALRDLDHDDHKWIAVALAEPSRPQIFQALDTEWWERRKDFAAAGVDVQFLCATDLLA
jgi:hypothetical protein